MEKIYYLENGSTDPRFNLAMEELLLTGRREAPIFMLWRNEPTVVIGFGQSAPDEVNLPAAAARGIHVIRRKTGGGAVYHDLGNVNFSFVYSHDTEDPLSLRELTAPIVRALRDFGADAFFSGRNDILIRETRKAAGLNQSAPYNSPPVSCEESAAAGHPLLISKERKGECRCPAPVAPGSREEYASFKVCGTAYRIAGRRILAHGCILFDTDLTVLSGILTPDKGKLVRHGVASVRSRVTNLRPFLPQMTTEDFLRRLGTIVIRSAESAEKITLSAAETAAVSQLTEDYPYITGS